MYYMYLFICFYFSTGIVKTVSCCPPKDPSYSNMAASIRVCCALRITIGGELFLFLTLHSLVKTVQCVYMCMFTVFTCRSVTGYG